MNNLNINPMIIPETRGGANKIYAFDEIDKGSSKFFPDAPDSIRTAAANFATRHKGVKFKCRTVRDKNKKRTGVTIYRP